MRTENKPINNKVSNIGWCCEKNKKERENMKKTLLAITLTILSLSCVFGYKIQTVHLSNLSLIYYANFHINGQVYQTVPEDPKGADVSKVEVSYNPQIMKTLNIYNVSADVYRALEAHKKYHLITDFHGF